MKEDFILSGDGIVRYAILDKFSIYFGVRELHIFSKSFIKGD